MTAPELRLALPVIALDEIRLRPWCLDDASALAAAWGDPTITAEATLPTDSTLAGAERWIEGAGERCRVGLAIDLAVADSADDRVVGEVGLTSIDPRRGAALIGWWVAEQERGRGVASTAVDGLAEWALHEAGFTALVAEISTDNEASQNVAERCGFEVLRPATLDRPAALVRRRG